jgi:multidrug resistance efflux pump
MSGSPVSEMSSSASSRAAAQPPALPRHPGIGPPPIPANFDPRGVPTPPTVDSAKSTVKKSGRWVYVFGVLVFLAYGVWMMGPYLRSVIVRDAAVTSWSNVATSPIDGEVELTPLSVNHVAVGSNGVILLVRNDRLSRQVLSEAEIRVDLARSRGDDLREFLNEVMLLDRGRADLKARFADTFRAQLDAEITSLDRKIGVTSGRLVVMRKIVARNEELARRGTGSEAAADEGRMRVSDQELEIAKLQADLDNALVRRQAADRSVFITVTGQDPDWVRGERLEVKLEKKQARLELSQAQADLKLATTTLKAATQDFQRLSEGAVRAPPGSVVWRVYVGSGATVRAGTPVAEWLDCSVLMIDVPVSDAEVSLIRPGMDAEVVLEGESVTRRASVLLTRGSASTLARDDLVALAKGRHDGVAQVLLEFPSKPEEFKECPVGRAAYVDFPDIGLIDVIRARLRL